METDTNIREAVRDTYARVSSRIASDCVGSCCSTTGSEASNEAESLRAGCGHPVTNARIEVGEVVLDLGSGAGADAFQASKLVGPSGRVVGVDSTPEMVWKARDLAAKDGVENVEFRLGEIEHLPLEAGSIDMAVSNCVLNLLPDKLVGFREIFRVLKPGGRIRISDLVTSNSVPRNQVKAKDWAACVEGAITEVEYLRLLRQAGFEKVQALDEAACSDGCCSGPSSELRSVAITGIKPASA